MKRGWGMLSVLILIGFSAIAQERMPQVDRREHRQLVRIRQGLVNGDLNRREAFQLLASQRHIRQVERRAKADGCITNAERLRLHRAQARSNREIFRQRHDRQGRLN
ncbi:MAG: hypothetical protein JNL40_12060 [Cyclobacteriaceae bacterium]|nr:hypothetical protein [Cyclobacteriaceae bacterium]